MRYPKFVQFALCIALLGAVSSATAQAQEDKWRQDLKPAPSADRAVAAQFAAQSRIGRRRQQPLHHCAAADPEHASSDPAGPRPAAHHSVAIKLSVAFQTAQRPPVRTGGRPCLQSLPASLCATIRISRPPVRRAMNSAVIFAPKGIAP